ncbi:hypothetical protein Tco_1301361 [Tanacetum coccineum]
MAMLVTAYKIPLMVCQVTQKLDGFTCHYSWEEKGASPRGYDSCPRLDADCLVADSTHMKVAFGDRFKMIGVPSSGIVTTSRYVVPTGRVKVPAGRYVVPTGKDNVIVSAGRTKVIPAGSTILVLVDYSDHSLLVYVDEIIVNDSNIYEIEKFKQFLKSKFMIKDLGKLKKYYLDLLSDFGLLACKPFAIHLEQNMFLSNEPTSNDPVIDNIIEYQKLIGKLIYLTHTGPDIAYHVHYLSKGIHITKSADTSLEVFVDADWAKCVVTRNQVGIKIEANLVFPERTKHLEIDLHFMRDKIISGVIETKKISSADQTANVLTKGLDKTQHGKLILRMGMYDMFQYGYGLS